MLKKIGFPDIPFAGITPVSTVRNTYELVKNFDGTKSLIPCGKEDINAIIESSREMALDAILDRFLDDDKSITFEDELALRAMKTSFTGGELASTKLDLLCDYYDVMEDTREALNLPLDMSFTEISAYLESNYNKIKEELNNGTKKPQTAPENAQSSKPENVPENFETPQQS